MTKKTYYRIIKEAIKKSENVLGMKLFQRLFLKIAWKWFKRYRKFKFENDSIATMAGIISYYLMSLSGRMVVAKIEISVCKDGPGKIYQTMNRTCGVRTAKKMLNDAVMSINGQIPSTNQKDFLTRGENV